MTELEQWQQSNARQLSAALAELRQRLERHAQKSRAAPLEPAAAPEAFTTKPQEDSKTSRSFLRRLLGGSSSVPDKEVKAPPVTSTEQAPAEPGSAKAELPSALTLLTQRLGLSAFEQDVLLLCTAMELDTRTPAQCAQAHQDPSKAFPTFALALSLFDNPSWDVLSPERPLRFFRLIEISQSNAQPLTASALRADERIVNYLNGLNHLDDRLAAFCSPAALDATAPELAASQAEVSATIVRHLREAGGAPLPAVQLLGPHSGTKLLLARHVAAQLGRALYRLPAELLPSAPGDLDSLARLWLREHLLWPVALYVDAQELDGASDKLEARHRFLTRCDGVTFLAVREPLARAGAAAPFAVDVAKPTPAEQVSAWAAALGGDAPKSPPLLAGQFNLDLADIQRIAAAAKADVAGPVDSLPERVWQACRAGARPRLDSLAQRLEPKVDWGDLVLPEAPLSLLKQLAAQVRQRRTVYGEWGFARKMNRGLGISALFAGASGTGKTMAAEVLAADLRLDLYRIDLSAVVSKYIGETEKNLRRLFDAAEDTGVILFFDEADALFGKRSEVKDSHDRYANIETNYLLQRIESYRGLAILATNLKNALDSAFQRRLRFVVDFPCPAAADRRRMWEQVFPVGDAERKLRGVPVSNLDFDRLARLNLTGGHIHNVALNAAFLAAQAGKNVSMPLVLEAARAEFEKLNRPINAADFVVPDTKSAPARAGEVKTVTA